MISRAAAFGGATFFKSKLPTGWGGPLGNKWFSADMILPSLTLGLFYAAYISRLSRGGMLEILTQDFIRTAKAKGASGIRVILNHALRGGLLPVISFMGPAIAGLIAGSFVIETIFAIPGLGQEFVQSVLNRDYTLVLGVVMFLCNTYNNTKPPSGYLASRPKSKTQI